MTTTVNVLAMMMKRIIRTQRLGMAEPRIYYQEEVARCDAEIAKCENAWAGDAELWLYLMGWADWKTERMLVKRDAYLEFLESKKPQRIEAGKQVQPWDCSPVLHDFQNALVRWSALKGRAAIFADCGLGKTLIQLEWARLAGGTCLIVAPLSVAEQTQQREAPKLDLAVRYVKTKSDLLPGLNITNYERIKEFEGAPLDSMVLDESSILKSVDGKTRTFLLKSFQHVPYRLCCTATPCPNDIAEIANHAEFLGVMTRAEMLASFFVHDQDGWRLRGHAAKPFFRWLASWAMALKNPTDIGFDGTAFALQPLNILERVIQTNQPMDGVLFPVALHGITGRLVARRGSLSGPRGGPL